MFSISFDFDETTQKVTNLKVVSSKPKELPKSDNYIEVQDNKLKFGKTALSLIEAVPNDRVAVNYWTVNNQETFPIIGKAALFTDGSDGQRLTKSGTMSYRGQQRTILLEYGSLFTLEEFKPGIYKMVPILEQKDSLEDEKNDLENLNTAMDNEIATLMSENDFDDLPF